MAELWSSSHIRSNGEASVLRVLPDHSIHSLAAVIGQLPTGDVPLAWYISTTDEVIKGWADYVGAKAEWNNDYARLLDITALPGDTKFITHAKGHFVGIYARREHAQITPVPTRWLRANREGYFVPRKRTKAEKESEVSRLFESLEHVPQATDFVPGMPDTLWSQSGMPYPVHMRRSSGNADPDYGPAVCAFVGADPDCADPPFVVSEHWTRMKLSTFHLLRERQEAGAR